MGKKSKEKKERRPALLSNPLVRKVVGAASRPEVVRELSKGTTEDQVGRLAELNTDGVLSTDALGKAIRHAAQEDVEKAITRSQREGKAITVDALCADIKAHPDFLSMCAKAGITLEWFEGLALDRMKARGL